jgi:hypothetical protein
MGATQQFLRPVSHIRRNRPARPLWWFILEHRTLKLRRIAHGTSIK